MKKLPVKPLPQVLHTHLSAPALLNQVRNDFEQVHDPRRYGQQFSLADVLMSGVAVFGLKFPSLLKFGSVPDVDMDINKTFTTH